MVKAKNRLQVLDALRGIAALGVVLFHYLPYYNELYGHSFDTPNVLEFGRYGVHLFFMLSGFVIFMTLERTENARWFGLARAFRLLPALWVGIIITFLTVHALGPDDRTVPLMTAIMNFTLLHSYLDHAHVDGAYWSLVIEMTFYVWMAILFYTLKNWQQLRMVLFSWVIVSYVAVINLESLSPTLFFITNDLLFTSYAPLFISGILLYHWYKSGSLTASEVFFLALSMSHALIAYPAPFNIFVLACYGIFVLAICGYLNFIVNRATLWLGSLSYSLYLVHQNIGYGIIDHSYAVGLSGLTGVAIALSISLILATAIHYYVEKPALQWFRERRQKAAPVPATN